MIWCPYSNEMIDESQANFEHIIPLSLGGSNSFGVLVDSEVNSRVGADIDGIMANEFLTSISRSKYNAKGHSKKTPEVILKNSRLGKDEVPVQVNLSNPDGPILWDSRNRKIIPNSEVQGATIKSSLKIGFYDDLKFIAKVALSAGYFIYGSQFKDCVAHEELRYLINLDKELDKSTVKEFKTKVCTRFLGWNNEDKIERDTDKLSCKSVDGSCVLTQIGQNSLGFTVGILGKWLGTIFVPANTDNFPYKDEAFDLGRVIVIEDKKMEAISYRSFMQRVQVYLKSLKGL